MAKYFCVFWYPTIFHREKKHRDGLFFDKKKAPLFQSIADIDKDNDIEPVLQKDLKLHIKETVSKQSKQNNEECFDLTFTLRDNDGNEVVTVFEYYNHSRNGFVIYSYDREQLINDFWGRFCDKNEAIEALRPTFAKRIKEKHSIDLESLPSYECVQNHTIDWLLISFYHLAKSFYHEHEVHSDADAKLESYYYKGINQDGQRQYLTEPPVLSAKNNPVINSYLDQYEQIFYDYAEKISQDYRQRESGIKEFMELRKKVMETLDKTNPYSGELRELIINFHATFDKLSSAKSKRKSHTAKDGATLVEDFSKSLPGEDITPPPPIDDIIEENDPSTITDVKELQRKLRESSRKLFLPFIDCLYDQVSTLSRICHNALIEYTYCRTLLGSKYNDDYKHDAFFSQTDIDCLTDPPYPYSRLTIRDDRRKKAFNIRNSIRYIEDIRQKCFLLESSLTKVLVEEVHGLTKEIDDLTGENSIILSQINTLTQKNNDALEASKKSNRLSYALGCLSVGLGLLSLAFALGEDSYPNMYRYMSILGALSILPAIYFALPTSWFSKKDKE